MWLPKGKSLSFYFDKPETLAEMQANIEREMCDPSTHYGKSDN